MVIPEARPPGIKLIQSLCKKEISYKAYQASVLVLTFIAYTLYHLARKPTSIVKSTLVEGGISGSAFGRSGAGAAAGIQQAKGAAAGWAPFEGASGAELLGDVDVAFLAVYAVGTFLAGHLGDRVPLRAFLAAGMVGSGLLTCLFGMAYWWDVHCLAYFFAVQMIFGLFQATGWPSVVAIVANWCGKRKRGLVMGVWNAHTSLGNICGSLIAAGLLQQGWGWCFLVPGLAILAGGVLMFLFLIPHPALVGLPSESDQPPPLERHSRVDADARGNADHGRNPKVMMLAEDAPLLVKRCGDVSGDDQLEVECVHAVGFVEALSIPGVVAFAMCLFFAKLVAYTFIYWLPFYIRDTEIGGEYLSDETSGNLSTVFDVGGVLGGILAGHLSDRLRARALTAATFTYCAIPAMACYRAFGGASLCLNLSLLLLSGLFVNGPYSLITTAVSADLGGVASARGGARSLATVTAIIDGTGSLGAALGPLVTGYVSQGLGWNAVFCMLTLSAFISGFLLSKQVALELNHNSTSSPPKPTTSSSSLSPSPSYGQTFSSSTSSHIP